MGDRIAGYGTSGTGKTTFTKHFVAWYLEHFPESIACILDTNPEHPFADWPGQVHSRHAPEPPMTPGEIQVWRPDVDDPEEYETYLGRILNLGPEVPALVVVDELSNLAANDSPTSYPRSLKLLLKQGRAAHKTTLVMTQEAAYILRQLLGQASHIFRWRLQLPQDSARINPYYRAGPEVGKRIAFDSPSRQVFAEPRRKYSFWHVQTDDSTTAREYVGWRQFL